MDPKYFPNQMEKVTVVPILKPGKIPTKPNSYRPIALSNTMSKLMEKIINYRFRLFLESKQLIFKFRLPAVPFHIQPSNKSGK